MFYNKNKVFFTTNQNHHIFNETIANKILLELDNCQIKKPETSNHNDLSNIQTNKEINLDEMEYSYNNCFDEGLIFANRGGINDLDDNNKKHILQVFIN